MAMNRRSLLLASTTVLFAVGGAFAFAPFIGAMGPSARAGATLPHFDISGLEEGDFIAADASFGGYGEHRILILRDYHSAIHVYRIRAREGNIVLPEGQWWRWGALCESFGPDMQDGKLRVDGAIRCHDNYPWFSTLEWTWTYDGKNMGKYTEDMQSPKFKVEGDFVVLGKH